MARNEDIQTSDLPDNGKLDRICFSPRHKFQCFSSPFSSRDSAFGRKDKDKITGTFDTSHKNRQGLDWRQSRSLTPNTYLPTAFPSQLDYE